MTSKLFVGLKYYDSDAGLEIEEYIDLDSIINIRKVNRPPETAEPPECEYVLTLNDQEDRVITEENYYTILNHMQIVNVE